MLACEAMSVTANQQRTFLRLLGRLRPHWHRDAALPARIQSLLASHREFGAADRRLYRELIYTTLRHLRTNDKVNLECDMIGKYVVRALDARRP